MFRLLQIASLITVSIAMALSLAHALELPGKLRLAREAYQTVQPIYYPGFTYGGFVGEFGGMLMLLALLIATPTATPRFWWTLGALLLLVAAHLTYWVWTHPANNFWLKDTPVAGFGAAFFSIFAGDPGSDWKAMRDVWEYSHVARAALSMASLLLLALAVTA